MSEIGNEAGAVFSRRELFGAAGAAAATLGLGGAALAQSHGGHGHGGHAAASGENAELIRAVQHCVLSGNACLAHCIKLLGEGDASLKNCARTVNAMLPVADALMRLAAMDATRLKFFAIAAADFCKDCQIECAKHADHHAECRACMESCEATVSEIRKLIV